MVDNVTLPPSTGGTRLAAADEATYSGDTAVVQLVRVVEVAGAEGSKTVISPHAVISTANSSTALLLLSGTFTGTGEDVTEYSHIVVSVYASHASATDGLQLQQSTNGTNWDWVDSYTVPATTGKSFSAPVQGKFFRVVFTNGGIMQTDFRIATLYSKQTKKGSSVRPQDGRSNENDFEETLAYGMGWNGTTWDRVKTTAGALNVIQPDATASGTLTALNDAVPVTIDGDGAWAIDLSGFSGHVVTFESQVNSGTTWRAINGALQGVGTLSATASADGTYRGAAAALSGVRARLSTTGTGSVTASARSSAGTSGTFLMAPIPTGSNIIGALTANQSVNKAQINGVAPLMGNGVSGTGSQRVNIASDNTPFAVKIDQTTPGSTNQVTVQPSTLAVTVTAAANTAATATLPAVAGQFHYITGIEIMRTATAALAGTATLVVTTTNLPGSLAWSFGNAMAAGATQGDKTLMFDNPVKSSVVNTATTIVMPAPGAAVLWRANVYYYTAA